MEDKSLYHHGIPGMHWGVRRASSSASGSKPISGSKKKATKNEIEKRKQIYKNAVTSKNRAAYNLRYVNRKTAREKENDMDVYERASKKAFEQRVKYKSSKTGRKYSTQEKIEKGKDTAKKILKTTLATLAVADIVTNGALHRAAMNSVSGYMQSKEAAMSITKITQNHKYDPIDVAYEVIK